MPRLCSIRFLGFLALTLLIVFSLHTVNDYIDKREPDFYSIEQPHIQNSSHTPQKAGSGLGSVINFHGRLEPVQNFSLEVTNEMIDAFRVTLPPRLPGFKSSCWLEATPANYTYPDSDYMKCVYQFGVKRIKLKQRTATTTMNNLLADRSQQGQSWRVRCLPYFFLLGVTKCGTTEVFQTLGLYVNDFAAPMMKEAHYWDNRGASVIHAECESHTKTRFARYLDSFDAAAEIISSSVHIDVDGENYHQGITGDFTPSTLNRVEGWESRPGNEGLIEPRYINAHYIHHLNPATKFMVIMRDPVERFYSNFRMKKRLVTAHNDLHFGRFNDTFLDITKGAIREFRECSKAKSLRSCCYAGHFDAMSHLTRGLYHVYIQDWLNVFPRNQFLFLTNEEFKSNRLHAVKKVIWFLDTTPLTLIKVKNIEEEQEKSDREAAAPSSPVNAMDPEAQRLLREFYSDPNHQLAHMLGSTLFDWGY